MSICERKEKCVWNIYKKLSTTDRYGMPRLGERGESRDPTRDEEDERGGRDGERRWNRLSSPARDVELAGRDSLYSQTGEVAEPAEYDGDVVLEVDDTNIERDDDDDIVKDEKDRSVDKSLKRVSTGLPLIPYHGFKGEEYEPLPDRNNFEAWIDRAVPPYQLNGKVLAEYRFLRRRVARMLKVPPREVKQPWSGGLFSCLDDGAICILTCFCPCVQFGLNAAYTQPDHFSCCHRRIKSKMCCSSCLFQAAMWFFIPCFLVIPFFVVHFYVCEGERGFPFDGAGPFECKYWWLTGGVSLARIPVLIFAAKYGGYFRKLMRQKYALPDDAFGEYFAYMILSFCAICQEARTIKTIERRRRLEAVLTEMEEEKKAEEAAAAEESARNRNADDDEYDIQTGGADVPMRAPKPAEAMSTAAGDEEEHFVMGVPLVGGGLLTRMPATDARDANRRHHQDQHTHEYQHDDDDDDDDDDTNVDLPVAVVITS